MVRCTYTPFGCTVEIARRLIDDVREGAVLRTTCTCPPTALHHDLEREPRTDREDAGASSFHPAGIPGTETRDLVLVADARAEGSGIELSSEEQVERCTDLAEDMKYGVYVLDPEIAPLIKDMSIVLTVRAVQAICNYLQVDLRCSHRDDRGASGREMPSTMAYSVGKHGMDALDKIDGEALLKSLRNMALTEGIERVVDFSSGATRTPSTVTEGACES